MKGQTTQYKGRTKRFHTQTMLLFENVRAYIALLGWEETIFHLNQVKNLGSDCDLT